MPGKIVEGFEIEFQSNFQWSTDGRLMGREGIVIKI